MENNMTVQEMLKHKIEYGELDPNETIRDIVIEYLELNEYDGLFYPGECGCKLDDLAPCDYMNNDCECGYYRKATEDDESGYDWYIQREKP